MPCHCWPTTGEESPVGGMRDATLCHTEMAEGLTALRAVVSSIVESALGRSPDKTFWSKLWASWLLNSGSWRISVCDLSGLA
jgi:hypothetical protein